MTEDEAKTKWCPFARVLRDFGTDAAPEQIVGPFNRDIAFRGNPDVATAIGQSLCIAAACMAWRWDRAATAWAPRYETYAGGGRSWNEPIAWKDSDTEGFCGLAGTRR